MIRDFELYDLEKCAQILIDVYNNDTWKCRWTTEKAQRYLKDYVDNKKFVGFTLLIDNEISGAIFCHEKTWWDNDEVFIDEMFISPSLQRKGYGSMLISAVEEYVKEHNLAGFTLSTNRFSNAPSFYLKHGFLDAQHVLYMYKSVI